MSPFKEFTLLVLDHNQQVNRIGKVFVSRDQVTHLIVTVENYTRIHMVGGAHVTVNESADVVLERLTGDAQATPDAAPGPSVSAGG